ncbi:MAG TPA: TadE/TadG family type IV pilus assembly protein [Pirellulales bacterium]|nr:TadE/TadG family type IV pilus assembly protein [Pirellulales bacterium]
MSDRPPLPAGAAATRRLLRGSRRGTAAVELALCLPLLLTTGLGMIEITNLVSIQARMQAAAYEAARLATRPTTSNATAASSDQVKTYCQTLLTQLGINGATVTLTPSDLSTATPQTLVTVAVSAAWKQNSPTSFVLQNSPTLSAQTTLIVE